MKKEKAEALKKTLERLRKEYGEGAIMRLGEKSLVKTEAFPSGILSLDHALGIGGYPRGRIIEIFGNEASGKTTLALHAAAEAQRSGGTCAFIDAEHALDINYAAKIGVDINNLYLAQPNDGEQALEIADELINSNAIDLIIIDSVAALVPRAEIQGQMGDAQMALQARLMSQALRKITGSSSKSKTAIIFINQIRMKIGQVWGNPETTTGGNALKFYATIRLEVRKGELLKKGDAAIGSKIRIKVVKNKVSPPFKTIEVSLIYGEGISKPLVLLELAVKAGIIKKSGSWFSYQEERIGQGQENVKKYFLENPTLLETVEERVREQLFPKEENNQKSASVFKEAAASKPAALEENLDFFEEQ